MGLFGKILSSEPAEIGELRKKIRQFEKSFESRKDYDQLQEVAKCQFLICRQHPDATKQTTALMSARSNIERVLAEAKIENLKPSLVTLAIEVLAEKEKTMFLQPLFEAFGQALKRFLDRLENATPRQINREKMSLNEILPAYKELADAAGGQDTAWFDTAIIDLERSRNATVVPQRQSSIHRTFGAATVPLPPATP